MTQTEKLPLQAAELLPLVREVLAAGGTLRLAPEGESMRPFLFGGESRVLLGKPEGRLKKYDIALCATADGGAVLHRVLRVLPGGYDLCGDANLRGESGLREADVRAKVVAFTRKGREISCDAPLYRLCVWLWCLLRLPSRLAAEEKRGTPCET